MGPFRYKVDLLATSLFCLLTTTMPCDYRTEAKTQFPLPEYPQEEKFEDAIQYEMAITQFGVDHMCILVQRDEWVDHKQIADIACASEATHLQVEADKQWREVEDCRVSEGERRPKNLSCPSAHSHPKGRSEVPNLLHRSWVRGSDLAAWAMSVVMAPWSRSSDTICSASPDMPEHIARCGSSSCSSVRTGRLLQSTAESSE